MATDERSSTLEWYALAYTPAPPAASPPPIRLRPQRRRGAAATGSSSSSSTAGPSQPPLRACFLHGWTQNGTMLASRCKRLVAKLENQGLATLRFPDGPVELPQSSTVILDDGQAVQVDNGYRPGSRAWYTYDPKDAAYKSTRGQSR